MHCFGISIVLVLLEHNIKPFCCWAVKFRGQMLVHEFLGGQQLHITSTQFACESILMRKQVPST